MTNPTTKELADDMIEWLESEVSHSIKKDVKELANLSYTLGIENSKATDSVVEAVRKDLLDRSNVGIAKYGTTLADNKGDMRYWLQHAYEEALDLANYLKKQIMDIDKMKPIDMILFCPECHTQHIDAPEPMIAHELCTQPEFPVWDNPPHRSHLCYKCGCIWRPADVETNGVAKITTIGKVDTWKNPNGN